MNDLEDMTLEFERMGYDVTQSGNYGILVDFQVYVGQIGRTFKIYDVFNQVIADGVTFDVAVETVENELG